MNKGVCVCFSDTGEATLRIIGVASEDDGVYTCVATNELGSVTSSASLRVLGERRDRRETYAMSVTADFIEPPPAFMCLSRVHRRGPSELEG